MNGLDTNLLARYYIADAGDAEARRQREHGLIRRSEIRAAGKAAWAHAAGGRAEVAASQF